MTMLTYMNHAVFMKKKCISTKTSWKYILWMYSTWSLKSKYVTTKVAANSFNLEFFCPKSRKVKTKCFYENVTWEQQSLPQHNLYLLRRAQFNIDWDVIWQCVQTIMANWFQGLKIVMPCISHSRNLYLFYYPVYFYCIQ